MTSYEAYASIHYVRSLLKATEEDLRLFVRTYPVIDNHAHNLLKEEHAHGVGQDYPFECIVSEAQGHVLHEHGQTSLAHLRGIRQLADLFNCPETLEDVKKARTAWAKKDYAGLIQRCLEGTHCLLIDDGLPQKHVHPGRWHRKFVPRVSRIVRVEAIAAELLEHLAQSAGLLKPGLDGDWEKDQSEGFLLRFNTMFRNQVRTLAQDPNVRGFKSVICYRSGLDVQLLSRNLFRPHQSLSESSLVTAFHEFIKQAVQNSNYRVGQKEVNDYLIVAVCDVLDRLVETDGENLPFQFHTGLGDTDIDLIKANPAYMQPLIEAYPNIDFVLLHSAYPYTREAGYLATNFANAWLDIGEVFPMLSRQGQESVLRQALELTPTSKILWSTDGHFYPESFYLANKQFRTVLEKVLLEYVRAGDFTVAHAIDSAADIMFWNSNLLYKLDEESSYPQLVAACGRSGSGSSRTQTIGSNRRHSAASKVTISSNRKSLSQVSTQRDTRRSVTEVSVGTPHVSIPSRNGDDAIDFLSANPTIKYIWAQFVDYTGTVRVRMMPVAQFKKHISTGIYPGITRALPRMLQNDSPAGGCSATGEFTLAFDLSSLSLNKAITSPSATVQSYWMNDNGSGSNEHFEACPRWALKKQLDILSADFGIQVLMGFEIEVVFVKPVPDKSGSTYESFQALHTIHSWSNLTYQQADILPMVEEIVEALADSDIDVSQFHAEAAPGQWEFPLPPAEPIRSIDTLYKAREIIQAVARKHGLKATLYPRPYPFSCGTASHAHFSINGPDNVVEEHADQFLAGVLEHLPAIVAFTLPINESYQRVAAGVWAGGEYVAWGTQNRETAIRKISEGHWELKTIDGMGNMYLSMAALMAAGLHGVKHGSELKLKDCPHDVGAISENEKAEYGITTALPKSIAESLNNLDHNIVLREMLGDGIVDAYIAVKTAEAKMLDAKGEDERRVWLISRY